MTNAYNTTSCAELLEAAELTGPDERRAFVVPQQYCPSSIMCKIRVELELEVVLDTINHRYRVRIASYNDKDITQL